MEKILLIIYIISALFLAGCNTNQDVNSDLLESNDNQNQEDIISFDENTSGEVVENSVPKYKYDSSKEIVYSFYKAEDDISTFDFPYINIDAENIEQLNEKIYNWAMPIISGTYFECSNAGYKYYLNDDILTVIITEESGYGGKTGFHLNIDVNTGKFINNSYILQKNGVVIEEISNLKDKLLNSKTTNTYESTLKEYYSKLGNEYDVNVGDKLLNNPEKWTLVYLDNEQIMHVIIELPTLAGAAEVSDFIDCIVEF